MRKAPLVKGCIISAFSEQRSRIPFGSSPFHWPIRLRQDRDEIWVRHCDLVVDCPCRGEKASASMGSILTNLHSYNVTKDVIVEDLFPLVRRFIGARGRYLTKSIRRCPVGTTVSSFARLLRSVRCAARIKSWPVSLVENSH
jgi:hypothetical protein